jgi:coenzyme F420-reducing hydrogenase delta subunit
MRRLKLVLYLAEKCPGCEFIQTKMGNTISQLLESVPNINFTDIICDNSVEPSSLQQALHTKADGVLVLSCRPEDCLDMMTCHRVIAGENSLTKLLNTENTEENENLAKAGGAKWISSN